MRIELQIDECGAEQTQENWKSMISPCNIDEEPSQVLWKGTAAITTSASNYGLNPILLLCMYANISNNIIMFTLNISLTVNVEIKHS